MDQGTYEQKDRVMKTLAVLGFLAVVIIGVWLAVQIVRVMPQAFTSLASIADSIYNYNTSEELIVETEKSTYNAGETFVISWQAVRGNGTYTFMYDCTDGVSLDIRDNTGSFSTINCGEHVSLGEDMTELAVTASSERSRFSDVAYTISFVEQGETEPGAVSENMVTVVNAMIPSGEVAGINDDATDEEMDSVTDEETNTASETEDTEVAVENEPTTSNPLPVYYETVVERPVSDPLGFTDLRVELLAVGELDSRDNFVRRGNIDEDARGAFQFQVVNLGTKTSDEWDFVATLTNGKEYDAPLQEPLEPKERAIFTLGYGNVGDDGIQMIGVRVRGGNDRDTSNNQFTWAVSVVN